MRLLPCIVEDAEPDIAVADWRVLTVFVVHRLTVRLQNPASERGFGLLRCRGNCLSRCGRFLAQKHLFSNIFNREFQLLPIDRFGDVMGETGRNLSP